MMGLLIHDFSIPISKIVKKQQNLTPSPFRERVG